MSIGLSPVLACAVAKAIKEDAYKGFRDKVGVGSHSVAAKIQIVGTLTVAPNTAGGAGGEGPGHYDPWLLLQMLLKRKGAPSIETLCKWGADAKDTDRAQVPALQAQCDLFAATLLPKVAIPGAAGARGKTSFTGTVLEIAAK